MMQNSEQNVIGCYDGEEQGALRLHKTDALTSGNWL